MSIPALRDLARRCLPADARLRRARLFTGTAFVALGTNAVVALIAVPLTLHFLGPERYGMWLTISGLVAMLSFADLGLGNGVLTQVANAFGRDAAAEIREITSSGVAALCLLALALLLLCALGWPWLDWAAVFNVHSRRALVEAGPAVAVFIGCYACTIPLAIVQKVQQGVQRGFASNLWVIAGSCASLLALLLALHARAGLPVLILALTGVPAAVLGLNFIVVLYGRDRSARPSLQAVSRRRIRDISGIGLQFLLLQICAAVLNGADALILAQLLGPESVAEYGVIARLFGLIAQVTSLQVQPLWPAYGEAKARHDWSWIAATYRRSLLTCVAVAGALSLTLLLAHRLLLKLWVGTEYHAAITLVCALAVWKTVEAAGNATAMLLNGTQVLRVQMLIAVASTAAALLMKVWLVKLIGISGVVWASTIAFAVFTLVPYVFVVRRTLRALRADASAISQQAQRVGA